MHSRPFKPKGRGKIERFFRTVRQQFLSVLERDTISGLADLDMRFHTWLESEYHRSPHRALGGKTPLELWLEKAHLVIPIDPTVNLAQVFLHEEGRKVHKDSTLTLDGVLYEVDSTLIGERIRLRFDPALPPMRRRVEVFIDSRPRGEARLVDAYANTRVRRANNSEHLVVEQPQDSRGSTSTPVTASLAASRLLDVHPKEDRQ